MNGPEQCAQALLKWKHGFKKNSASKRKISYRDQLLRLIGHQEAYPPAKKRAKIDELLSVISNPFHLAVLINTPSRTLASCRLSRPYAAYGISNLNLKCQH
jgi:hypothetical protein